MPDSRTQVLFATSLALILAIALVAAGCTQPQGGSPKAPEQKIQSLSIAGSTTVLPVAQAAADAFMNTRGDADIRVSGGGSSVGIQSAGERTADIGMSSRDLKPEEKDRYPDLVATVIGNDGIAVIVHSGNSVGPLTPEQVKGVYQGTYTNWKELGGPDLAIVVVGRDSASGTREFFHEKVMKKEDFVPTQLEKNSNGAVKQTVMQTPGAIGYVGLGYVDATTKAVPVMVSGSPVDPTVGNVLDGKYPIARPLLMVTMGEPGGLAKEYLAFLTGPSGQAILAEEGFVPLV
ncbi:MAG: phosphate ABC transporter periplasmic substrate-binding protein PstS [Methanoregulaceae archaeon PtaB.Bin009]|jgi:phosphate transport system substrate-binding protein|nr:MAG: phosphate ABC transporter periplasmic substrate-binding protein PstS [Methanoregulaceae archaeon PtaB.Bin009]